MKTEILQLEDIKLLVDNFYAKVKADPLLAPIFDERIANNWPHHMDKMYRFWQTVLLGEHTYLGSPFAPHANLPIDKTHFTQWLSLFHETIDEHFSGEKAEEAKWRSIKMAEMFQLKIAYRK
ncbi:group III truncated hemoglobin [Marinoscillum luteum]|uniref:Group III truncated hemoglobin n=1 Tax=Marinoscillum luteum TaxID=861051 RepID=A0ABW7NFZ5_9BACT